MPHEAEERFAKRVGGHLSLDFVNTVGGRVSNEIAGRSHDYCDQVVREWIGSYDDFVRWGALAGAVTEEEAKRLSHVAQSHPDIAAGGLTRALELREGIYRVFKAVVEGWPPEPEDLATLNRELRIARANELLSANPRFVWVWDPSTPSLDRVIWPVARAAAELLTSLDRDRVGQCPGEECGWLFLDTSRSRRRQWCDMKDCGNLAKVHRFRERQRVESSR